MCAISGKFVCICILLHPYYFIERNDGVTLASEAIISEQNTSYGREI